MAATYTVKQVAQILGYSTNSIYTFLKEKRIKGVRIGRGRFRIPQPELDRLLSTVKSPKAAGQEGPAVTAQFAKMIAEVAHEMAAKPDGVSEAQHGIVSPRTLPGPRVEMPSYFDWFFGLTSILLGLSLSLFSKTFDDMIVGVFASAKPVLQTSMVAAGIGILLSDIRGMGKGIWHWVFHGVLILTYLAFATLLILLKDYDGALIFGGLGTIAVGSGILGLGGVGSFTLYVLFLMAIVGPVSVVFLAGDLHVSSWMQAFGRALPVAPIIMSMSALLGAAIVWWAYRVNKGVYAWVMVVVGVFLTVSSFLFAAAGFWTRSFFMLLVGFFCLFSPAWTRLTFTHRHDRRMVFSLFGAIFCLYVLAIVVVRVFQANILEYASGELSRKLTYVRIVIESTLRESRGTIESAATNPLVIDAFAKGDTETLNNVARSHYSANTSLRRLLFVASNGDMLVYYPLANALTTTNVAFREYFTVPIATKKIYMSDLFDTRTETVLNTVVIAAPVLDSKKAIVGVVVGSLNLEALGERLQEITAGEAGEYVVVIDKNGRRIIAPDQTTIGKTIDADDPVRLGIEGSSGITEGPTVARVRAITAYGSLPELGWAIAVKAPIATVLAGTVTAAMVTFSVSALTVVVIGLFVLSRTLRRVGGEGAGEEGSPSARGQPSSRMKKRPEVPGRSSALGKPVQRKDSS